MNFDSTARVKNLIEINRIELKIAEPTNILKRNAEDGFFSQIAKLANSSNATKSIAITLSANEQQKEKLDKKSVIETLAGFLPIHKLSREQGNTKDKLIVVGKTQNEYGTIIEETINIVLNRFEDKFNLEKLRIAPHLQIVERKEGLTLIAVRRFSAIKKLI